jgi:hypothetical protein
LGAPDCGETVVSLHPPPSTFTITATTPPTTPPAPALIVESRLSSPAFSAREPLQRPDPGLKLLVLRLHLPQHPADPLHVPVRLVKPSSRVVFVSVILVTFPESNRMPERKRLTVRVIAENLSPIQASPIKSG